MKRWSTYFLLIGGIIILFGILSLLVLRGRGVSYVWGHFIAGSVLLLLGLFLGKGKRKKLLQGEKRKLLVRSMYGTGVLGLLLITVSATVLVSRQAWQWDVTEQKVNSISQELQQLLYSLPEDLVITLVQLPSKTKTQEFHRLVSGIKRLNAPRVTLNVLHALRDHNELQTLQLKTGEQVHLSYGPESHQMTSSEISEEVLFNEIVELTRPEAKKVYYIEGHGEPSLTSMTAEGLSKAKELLRGRRIDLEGLVLPGRKALPADTEAVLLAAPRESLSEIELGILENYVNEGGSLLLLHDPFSSSSISELAARWDIQIDDAIVVDELHSSVGGHQLGLQIPVRMLAGHALFKGMTETDSGMLQLAAPVRFTGKSTASVKWSTLLESSASSWAEFGKSELLSENPSASFDPDRDRKGPLSMGLIRELSLTQQDGNNRHGKLLVIGDIDWVRNSHIEVLSNSTALERIVEYLSLSENWKPLPARSLRRSVMPVSREVYFLLLAGSFLFPELLLLFGITVWWRRKGSLPLAEEVYA